MPRPSSLSYILNKKTDKLLKANRNKTADIAMMVPFGTVAGLLWIFFLANMNRYLDAWISMFNSRSAAPILSSLESIYFKVLFITTVLFVFTYALWNRHNEKFKKYKKEVFEILDTDPCYHPHGCSCVDEYCLWIEDEEGVDFI